VSVFRCGLDLSVYFSAYQDSSASWHGKLGVP